MEINPYLGFNGNCGEAFDCYRRVLGGTITGRHTFGDMPPGEEGAGQVPPEWQDKIMHISLQVGNVTLMGSDAPPGMHAQPQGFHISIHPTDPAEGERIFNALAEGGEITMPYQETFWAQRFGMLVDRFGTPWMVNVDRQG